MNQEVDYAEMLEIPVSTVNVVKRGKKRDKKDLREKIIKQVNADMSGGEPDSSTKEDDAPLEDEPARTAESVIIEGQKQNEQPIPKILIAEFACACLLCTTIFLTNIFMSDSLLNKLVSGAMDSGGSSVSASDGRTYSDFSLSSVVSERANVEQQISSSGVLSFTGECSVYPVCDGKVLSVTQTDGLYTLSLSHSDSFESVIAGLSSVYYSSGDSVKGNIPIGYTDGESQVSVMLYSDDSLLNCYTLDEENCLVWKS